MYEKMFTELKIGTLTIRNRIVDEPHQVGLNIAGEEGGIVVTELACVETLTGCEIGMSLE